MINPLARLVDAVILLCLAVSCGALAGFVWVAFKFLEAFAAFAG